MLPAWGQVVLGIAAVITAVGVIWTKVLRPGARLVTAMERMYPLLIELTEKLGRTPQVFDVLHEIVGQVRSNSGSSLKDMIEELSRKAEEQQAAEQKLAVSLEADRELAKRDREQMARVLQRLDRVSDKVDTAVSSLVTIRQGASDDRVAVKGVASDLADAQRAVEGVASDLADSHARATAVGDESPHGAAADAASRGDPGEEQEE